MFVHTDNATKDLCGVPCCFNAFWVLVTVLLLALDA